jgi:hypothetical protein
VNPALLLIAVWLSSCGEDGNPAAPETELVGTWILVSSNELSAESIARIEPRLQLDADGTMIISRTLDGVITEDVRRWAVSEEGLFEETLTIEGEDVVRIWQYTLEGVTLTLVHEAETGEDRFVEVYVRTA